MIVRAFLIYSSDFNVCTDRARICLICQVKEKEKKCSFEKALVEKSESSTRNKNGLVEGLLLFSIQMFTFTDLSRFILDLTGLHALVSVVSASSFRY